MDMRPTTSGSARTLLLLALALAAAVMVGSIALLAVRGSGSQGERTQGGGDPDGAASLGGGRGAVAKSKKPRQAGDESEEGGEDEESPDAFPSANSRDPEGDVEAVTEDTLRAVFKVRHWEETCRQINELLIAGKPVPADVVRELIELLAKDDVRAYAVMALGVAKDDATGLALAQAASSADAPLDVRQAALDALARGGQKSALPALQALASSATEPPEVSRRAYFALAAVGGADAARTLIDQLGAHAADDDLRGVLTTALGRTHDADAGVAEMLRAARDKGDRDRTMLLLQVAHIQGADAGAEVKAELRRVVESDAALATFETDEDRLRVQGTAMPAAAAAGVVEPVLRAATTAGPMRDIALRALRQARGDAAAKLIAAAIQKSTDEAQKRELTAALGETASFAATATLVSLLDDPSANVRQAAATGLQKIRDPAGMRPVLSHLEKAAPDADFARNLVGALGTIGVVDALPALEKLAASEEDFWRQLRPWVQNAIVRVKTGNPESQRLK